MSSKQNKKKPRNQAFTLQTASGTLPGFFFPPYSRESSGSFGCFTHFCSCVGRKKTSFIMYLSEKVLYKLIISHVVQEYSISL